MVDQIPPSDIVVANADAITAGNGDVVIINRDILISAAGGATFDGIQGTTNALIHVLGTVESAEGDAIRLTEFNNVVNEGIIVGAVGVEFASAGNFNFLKNTGTISALSFVGTAILGGAGSEQITNAGTIIGIVQLGGGADTFDGRGGHVVTGFVDLGAGNDLGIGGDFGDSFSGGDGNDTVVGNGGNDSYGASGSANDGNDLFNGGDGTDEYSALNAASSVTINLEEGVAFGTSIGRDTLIGVEDATGSHLDDFIFGNTGANTLFGGAGLDTMSGGGGNDTISGEAGNDTITGGAGADFLTGGADNDTFDYNKLSESGLTAATRDEIFDFVHGDDRLDLSTLDAVKAVKGNQSFKFVAGGFTKAGQVHAVVHGSDTLVEINIDKDKAPEMTILLHGAVALSAGDFIL